MLSVTDTAYVDGAPGQVFAALADPETQLIYDRQTFVSIEQLSPGPAAAGSRFRARLRGVGSIEIEYEYVEFDRGACIEQLATTPFGEGRHRFVFSRSGDGTRLVQTISLVPNLLGQALWPAVLKRMMEARVQSLNDRVKTYVEATSPHLR